MNNTCKKELRSRFTQKTDWDSHNVWPPKGQDHKEGTFHSVSVEI